MSQRNVGCPLCGATVPSASLAVHLRRELLYAPLRCLLCPVTFAGLPDARAHFEASPLAQHPGERVRVTEQRDEGKDREVLRLYALAAPLGPRVVDLGQGSPSRPTPEVEEAQEEDIREDSGGQDETGIETIELSSRTEVSEVSAEAPSIFSIATKESESARDLSDKPGAVSHDQTFDIGSSGLEKGIDEARESSREDWMELPSPVAEDGRLPVEAQGFLAEQPAELAPRSHVVRKPRLACRLCGQSVNKAYVREHVSTKHLRKGTRKCSLCSYASQHWADTIGLREHLSRKHQLKLTSDYAGHFEDLRPALGGEMTALMKRCFPQLESASDAKLQLKRLSAIENKIEARNKATSRTELLVNETRCRLCSSAVPRSETRNHIMLQHIKAPGFSCKRCSFEVPYWLTEFKQMRRHIETEHGKADVWQTEFVDLRGQHYEALKTFLRNCFGEEARSRTKEVYRLRAKPERHVSKHVGKTSEALLRANLVKQEKSAEKEPAVGVGQKRKVELVCACGRDVAHRLNLMSRPEALQYHIWRCHGDFARLNPLRCRVCERGMSLQVARRHMRNEHKVAEASLALRNRFFRDIRSKEDVAKVMALVEANFSAAAREDREALSQRDYESLSRSQKIVLRLAQNRRHRNDQVPPLTEQDVLRVQPWLCCAQCEALVAQSDVERHVSWDHLRLDVLVCRRCRRVFPGSRPMHCLPDIERHLAAEHAIEVPLSRLVDGGMVSESLRRSSIVSASFWMRFEEARKHLLKRPQPSARPAYREELRRCFGDAAKETSALMAASFGLTPLLSRDTWPTDVPVPSKPD